MSILSFETKLSPKLKSYRWVRKLLTEVQLLSLYIFFIIRTFHDLLPLKKWCICLFWKSHIERERQKLIFHPLAHSPGGHTGQGWARPKQQPSFILVSLVDFTGTHTWASSRCFPRLISRELGHQQRCQCHRVHYVTMPAPASSYKNWPHNHTGLKPGHLTVRLQKIHLTKDHYQMGIPRTMDADNCFGRKIWSRSALVDKKSKSWREPRE